MGSRILAPVKKTSIVRAVAAGFLLGIIMVVLFILVAFVSAKIKSPVLDAVLQTTSPILWPASSQLGHSSNSAAEEYGKWGIAIAANGILYALLASLLTTLRDILFAAVRKGCR